MSASLRPLAPDYPRWPTVVFRSQSTARGSTKEGATVATYEIRVGGSWPVENTSPRDRYAGEMFSASRDGEPARSLLATVQQVDLDSLVADLKRDGIGEAQARGQARYTFRLLAAEAARRFAEAGSLRYRDGDNPLHVPVELVTPRSRNRARSSDLIRYEPGATVGEPFEADD